MQTVKSMKLYIVLVIIFLCGNCSINTNLFGKYSSIKSSNSFQFKEDSTFVYEYRSNHLFQYSHGKWKKKKGDMITLTSEIKSTVVPLFIKSVDRYDKDSNNLISLNLKIENCRSLSDYMCGVYINNKLYSIKRCDSISSILITIPIKNCYFHFTKEPEVSTTTAISPPVFTSKYIPGALEGNKINFSINFNDSYFYYKAFNEDTVKVEKHSIEFFNSYSKKWEKIPRVSNESNIFSRFHNTLKNE